MKLANFYEVCEVYDEKLHVLLIYLHINEHD